MPHTSTRAGNNDRALRSTAAEVAGEGIRRLGIVEEAVAEDLGYEAVARTDKWPFPLQTGLCDMIRTWAQTSSFWGVFSARMEAHLDEPWRNVTPRPRD